ncbi:MAG TPA: MarR family transcriptional regulator [Jatrophihabitantaceae bacterium]|nr:MarR family transcriptional regulator [Jatrophihabitantaceae bacterium]
MASSTATASDASVRPDVAAVADTFVALMRTFVRTRSRLLAAAQHDVEWSAHVLLRALTHEGPMRSSALADRIESDPSTVSRQVAALVRDGLVERRADPEDGRATLLVPTPKADAILREQNQIRLQHFDRMLADWSAADLRTFGELLERFTKDFDEANTHWPLDRVVAGQPPAQEGTA